MPSKIRLLSPIVLLALLSAMLTHVSELVPSSLAQTATAPVLRLHRTLLQQRGHTLQSIPQALQLSYPDYAIIQYAGPIQVQDRARLEATGLSILEYLPDYAYLVRGTSTQLEAAASLPRVYARHAFLTMDKLEPTLLSALIDERLNRSVELTIQAWPGQERQLDQLFLRLSIDPKQALTSSQIMELAGAAPVRWIEPRFEAKILNDRARAIMNINSAWVDHGLYGAGQIVAIADSGLDTGDADTLTPDFAGRIVASHILADNGTLADEFGHGTHVAGSLLGAGVRSGAIPEQHSYSNSFAGVAPEASLVVQAFEVDANTGAVEGLSNDPYAIFAQAYADGARIHSDSWGGPTGIPFLDVEGYFGGYTTPSRSTDQFIWEHPDMTIFVAAGNSGNDGDYILIGCLPNGDGWIDEDSLLAPGTAKNAITVGASENLRFDGNLSTLTWGDFPSGGCYAKDPVASDLLSNNANGIAAFSSRGPVNDGRIKPDLVAPGTSIVSNKSAHPSASDLWGAYTPNRNYTIAGGTSMSTPLTAGAGVLVREWLGKQGLQNPSAAAIKAVLLSTSADIAPGQYVVGDKQEIPALWPNTVAGWGRVDLSFLSKSTPYQLWLDDHHAGLTTGQIKSYDHSTSQPLLVSDSNQPLRITLAWSDPPASLSSSRQLVNDLDLVVLGPDGKRYWGNQTTDGDRINNVEGVIIPHPAVGLYRVEVRTHNIPIEQQPYALVAAGPLVSESLVVDTNAGLTLDEGQQATISTDKLQIVGTAAEQIRYSLIQAGAHGKLLLDGQAIIAGQHFSQTDINRAAISYSHDGSETLSDSLELRVEDNAAHQLGPLSFDITIRPVNDPPVANADRIETISGQAVVINVLANDSDAEQDSLQISGVGTAQGGTATSDDTQVIYTPAEDFTGRSSFEYTISDGNGGSDVGSVEVIVNNKPQGQRYLFVPIIVR